MMTTLATPSIALSSPKAIRATEPAITPATTATVPSIPSQTRLNQDSNLARRAAASHSRDAAAGALAGATTGVATTSLMRRRPPCHRRLE